MATVILDHVGSQLLDQVGSPISDGAGSSGGVGDLLGQSARVYTGVVGTFQPPNVTVALVGRALATSCGAVAQFSSTALGGKALTIGRGSTDAGIGAALLGVSVAVERGDVTTVTMLTTAVALSGMNLSTYIGVAKPTGPSWRRISTKQHPRWTRPST